MSHTEHWASRNPRYNKRTVFLIVLERHDLFFQFAAFATCEFTLISGFSFSSHHLRGLSSLCRGSLLLALWRWLNDTSTYTTALGQEASCALEAARPSSFLHYTCCSWKNFSSVWRTMFSEWRIPKCHLPVFFSGIWALSAQLFRKIIWYKTIHIVHSHSN